MSTTITDYLRYAWHMLNGYRASIEARIFAEREQDITGYLDGQTPIPVLDLGNGQLRPQYSLLKAAGYRVYGIDLANRPERSLTSVAYLFARALYRWKLNLPIAVVDRTLVCAEASDLPFPDDAFELVTSVAAFEHFLDVPAVVTELRRVLRPGGLVYACIHLFTCPSGGHNVRISEVPLCSLPRDVDPWDHLRKRRLPFHVPLNEWRRDQYFQLFAQHFEILKHYCATREGEEFLTPEIEAELSAYTRDELTCVAYVIVARKPLLSSPS
jgi:SAM-dependent methyltransferase